MEFVVFSVSLCLCGSIHLTTETQRRRFLRILQSYIMPQGDQSSWRNETVWLTSFLIMMWSSSAPGTPDGSGPGGGPAGAQDRPADHERRRRRPDELQPGHRRRRQGADRPRDRCPRRRDGQGHRRQAGIQFRMLNLAKGPAMHSPRAQADKKHYQFTMKHRVEAQPNLTLRQEVVEALVFEDAAAWRRRAAGSPRRASACGRSGPRRHALSGPGRDPDHRHLPQGADAHGRGQEPRRPGRRSVGRGAQRQPGVVRLRAGPLQDRHALPAQRPNHRLFAKTELQPGDAEPRPFSFATERITQPQMRCHITYTNERSTT